MPLLGVRTFRKAREPAVGMGHVAEVLREYFDEVQGSDIFDYGYRPEHFQEVDFLSDDYADDGDVDWYMTNPPFGERATMFILKALALAKVGVAMFLQVRYCEGIDRYEQIFRDRPPTLCAFFVERVPLHMGRYEPEGGTKTAYWWLVWLKGQQPRAPFWIPPGCRESLARDDDDERFTQHPVRALPQAEIETRRPAVETAPAPAWTSPLAETEQLAAAQDELEIPAFLRRNAKGDVPAEHSFTLTIDWDGAGPKHLGTDVATCTCGKELRVNRGATPEENAVAREKLVEMMDAHKRAMGAPSSEAA